MARLRLTPIDWQVARAFVLERHRHNLPARGWKFGIGVERGGELVGVAIVGRPVARCLDDGRTLEVTRCCTAGAKNACSMLYGAAWRAAKAMGYRRLVTYTLSSEPGVSLRAAGWLNAGAAGGGSWSRTSRQRGDSHPLDRKTRWEVTG